MNYITFGVQKFSNMSSVSVEDPYDTEPQGWAFKRNKLWGSNNLAPLAKLNTLAWELKGSTASGSRTYSTLLHGGSSSSWGRRSGHSKTKENIILGTKAKSCIGPPKEPRDEKEMFYLEQSESTQEEKTWIPTSVRQQLRGKVQKEYLDNENQSWELRPGEKGL